MSGFGKFNLFDIVCLNEQTIAAKLSSVLGFVVSKAIIALSVLCIKCKTDLASLKSFSKEFFFS